MVPTNQAHKETQRNKQLKLTKPN